MQNPLDSSLLKSQLHKLTLTSQQKNHTVLGAPCQ